MEDRATTWNDTACAASRLVVMIDAMLAKEKAAFAMHGSREARFLAASQKAQELETLVRGLRSSCPIGAGSL